MNTLWVFVTNRRQASIIISLIHFNLISYGANKRHVRSGAFRSRNIFGGEIGVRGEGWGGGGGRELAG